MSPFAYFLTFLAFHKLYWYLVHHTGIIAVIGTAVSYHILLRTAVAVEYAAVYWSRVPAKARNADLFV